MPFGACWTLSLSRTRKVRWSSSSSPSRTSQRATEAVSTVKERMVRLWWGGCTQQAHFSVSRVAWDWKWGLQHPAINTVLVQAVLDLPERWQKKEIQMACTSIPPTVTLHLGSAYPLIGNCVFLYFGPRQLERECSSLSCFHMCRSCSKEGVGKCKCYLLEYTYRLTGKSGSMGG